MTASGIATVRTARSVFGGPGVRAYTLDVVQRERHAQFGSVEVDVVEDEAPQIAETVNVPDEPVPEKAPVNARKARSDKGTKRKKPEPTPKQEEPPKPPIDDDGQSSMGGMP